MDAQVTEEHRCSTCRKKQPCTKVKGSIMQRRCTVCSMVVIALVKTYSAPHQPVEIRVS